MKYNKTDSSTQNEDRYRLARIVCSLSTITLFAKFCGFGEKLVIAHFFGTSDLADVYFATTGIILSIIWIIRELMYPSLLPIYVNTLKESRHSSETLFRKVFLSTAMFLGVAAVIIILFAKSLCKILVIGYSETKQLYTAHLLTTLTPAMFFIGLSMITYTVLNANKKFIKAACPEAALKLFIVVGLIVLAPVMGIYALALVMGLGGLGCLLVQLYFIPERRFLFKPSEKSEHVEHFKKLLLLMSPLIVGIIFSHISGLVDNMLASTLPSGRLSYLNYSKKLIDATLLIGPVALVTVVYAELSHLASLKEYVKFKYLVIKSCRLLIFLSIPIACFLIILKQPLIQIFFQRGEFNIESTMGTSQAFMIYCFGLTTFSLETLFVFTFFAMSNTKTPVIFGILCVILDIVLAIILIRPFEYLGIAGAFVISKTIKIIILGVILNRQLKGLFDLQIVILLAKLGVTTLAIGLSMKLLLAIDNADSSLNILTYDIMIPAIGALLSFVLCSYLLKIKEFKAAVSLIKDRKATVRALYGEAK